MSSYPLATAKGQAFQGSDVPEILRDIANFIEDGRKTFLAMSAEWNAESDVYSAYVLYES
jgi:hypothetical protein